MRDETAGGDLGLPWYRQFWPWFIIALPAAAVIGGLTTLIIAIEEPDGMVAGDYYRQGLAINRVLARDDAARRLGLSADVELGPGAGATRLLLHGALAHPPPVLTLHLVHPTRAHLDVNVVLRRDAQGAYVGSVAALAPGHWHVVLDSESGGWRVAGRMWVPEQHRTHLLPGGA